MGRGGKSEESKGDQDLYVKERGKENFRGRKGTKDEGNQCVEFEVNWMEKRKCGQKCT